MNKYFLLLFSILLFDSLYSQQVLSPCGTIQGRSEWLVNYQKDPGIFPRSEATLYVPLTINIVGTDSGKGYILGADLLGSLCTLNDDFADADIRFFIHGDLNFINNSDYMFHQTVLEGADMMFANNTENTINNYIVSQAAGNCGYNLPYAGVCLAINCTQPTDHTWAHEIGHNLSLPHPFLGWEGGVSHDGSVPHSFNNPAPERITYDYTFFQDTLIPDTLIIDTAWVEKVDGSNCTYAADGFCDTKPDYIASRWACDPATGLSPNGMKDPDGVQFQADGSLIMSYADDACSYRFTEEQMGAMRANLLDEKPNLLFNQSEPILIDNPEVNIISPQNGETQPYDQIILEWEPIENATYYVVRISTNTGLTTKLYDAIVSEPRVVAEIEQDFADRDLYWSVIPFNSYDFCHTYSTIGSFVASSVSGTINEKEENLSFYPNILSQGINTLYTDFENTIDKVSIVNINGQEIFREDQISKMISVNNLATGLYLLQIENKGKRIHQKIIVK